MDWLNTSKPISVTQDLSGKVAILDFFTFCCINCIHVLPYLKEVEDKMDPSFVVIGVHSPKFPNEKELNSVTEAVRRNKITHPVLNDPESILWRRLGVSCWPTVVIIGPSHEILFALVGESQIDKISFLYDCLLEYYKIRQITLNLIPFPTSTLQEPKTKLLYPGNVSSHEELIVISDSGHNRLLILEENGQLKFTIGTGEKGDKDGSFKSSSFDNPHGTTFFKNNIYVADTGNHSIRKIDLEKKLVYTVYKEPVIHEDNENNSHFLSPWDICVGPRVESWDLTYTWVFNFPFDFPPKSRGRIIHNIDLYASIYGKCNDIPIFKIPFFYLFFFKFRKPKCVVFAGNGKEENRNNAYRLRAGFAQPSGISYSQKNPGFLFVADSESSTIRSISLTNGAVKTVVGGSINPLDLFQFGDVDGKGNNAKLQHPMSVCSLKQGVLLITDTYNHKVKQVELESRTCSTLTEIAVSNNNKVNENGQPLFSEPSGICTTKDGKVIVADTNNHCLKLLDVDLNIINEVMV
ncbi:NHL repeat-containing protein 2-like [Uloborus diversus]|uniref:NHL repeat-containing protein 2-like n=1 Tax=Uloborus diversus TaxID=327109 RepID=UPI002409C592|nr:NHL repeat-containing protein 2-like [Uloborus diversus]